MLLVVLVVLVVLVLVVLVLLVLLMLLLVMTATMAPLHWPVRVQQQEGRSCGHLGTGSGVWRGRRMGV
jgi:hypothetical protein